MFSNELIGHYEAARYRSNNHKASTISQPPPDPLQEALSATARKDQTARYLAPSDQPTTHVPHSFTAIHTTLTHKRSDPYLTLAKISLS
jgi:hypothetical protein